MAERRSVPATHPTVSVVMTAWNAAAFVAEALDSALAQTRLPDEIIVNDDGSTDDTVDIVRRYDDRVVLLISEHAGQAAGRNRALERASGEVIAFLDADDVWLPTHVEGLLAVLAAAPELEAVFSATDEFLDPSGAADAARPPRAGAVGPILSAGLLRRSLIDRVGPFRAGIELADWIDWWSRATSAGARFVLLTEVLTRRRLHTHNTTIQRVDRRREYLGIIRERLAQQRASEAP